MSAFKPVNFVRFALHPEAFVTALGFPRNFYTTQVLEDDRTQEPLNTLMTNITAIKDRRNRYVSVALNNIYRNYSNACTETAREVQRFKNVMENLHFPTETAELLSDSFEDVAAYSEHALEGN